MADEQATGSVLDELMKDDSTTEEVDPKLEETDDEEITPDSEVPLNIEDDEDSEEDKDEEETNEEESEKEDEEEDLTDKEENELELAKIPSRKEIKAKFPTLFKEFPQLEQAFYREREYT